MACEHVHFYWLCRSQEEFEWFHQLLRDALKGASADRFEVNLFQTGTVELSEVENFGDGSRQFFGRPNWGRILPTLANKYPGDSVGVFLCGPAAIREDLRTNTNRANGNDKGTHFTLYAENF